MASWNGNMFTNGLASIGNLPTGNYPVPLAVGNVANTIGNLNTTDNGLLSGLNGFFRDNRDLFSGIGTIGSLGLAGYNIFNSLRQNEIMQDYLNFQRDLANRNLANQAKLVNNQIDANHRIASSMVGGVNADGSVGLTSQAVADAYNKKAEGRRVDGSAIG